MRRFETPHSTGTISPVIVALRSAALSAPRSGSSPSSLLHQEKVIGLAYAINQRLASGMDSLNHIGRDGLQPI